MIAQLNRFYCSTVVFVRLVYTQHLSVISSTISHEIDIAVRSLSCNFELCSITHDASIYTQLVESVSQQQLRWQKLVGGCQLASTTTDAECNFTESVRCVRRPPGRPPGRRQNISARTCSVCMRRANQRQAPCTTETTASCYRRRFMPKVGVPLSISPFPSPHPDSCDLAKPGLKRDTSRCIWAVESDTYRQNYFCDICARRCASRGLTVTNVTVRYFPLRKAGVRLSLVSQLNDAYAGSCCCCCWWRWWQ